MKFSAGDATDTALCVALKHEFLRCDDAFNEFAQSAAIMVTRGEDRRVAYRTYNAYSRFIHHLYEFMLGAVQRDRQNTEKLDWKLADRYIAGHAQRILTNRRTAILNKTSPSWENNLSYYPEKIPPTFAKEFRQFRNISSGHVKYERSSRSLTKFYHENHKYLYILYHEAKSWWGRQTDEFPDLKEITAFSVLLKDEPPKQP
jgi:hypothetical protein